MVEALDYEAVFKQSGSTQNFAAGTTLLEQGDTAQRVYLVQRGALRLGHNDAEGRDTSLQFFFEGQFVASFESFYLHKPSMFAITALEDTQVLVIDDQVLRQALEADSELMATFTAHICHRFIDYTQYFLNRIEKSPEARYRDLELHNPALIKRVPHTSWHLIWASRRFHCPEFANAYVKRPAINNC